MLIDCMHLPLHRIKSSHLAEISKNHYNLSDIPPSFYVPLHRLSCACSMHTTDKNLYLASFIVYTTMTLVCCQSIGSTKILIKVCTHNQRHDTFTHCHDIIYNHTSHLQMLFLDDMTRQNNEPTRHNLLIPVTGLRPKLYR